jgi:putative glutamine amidotransferase
MTKPLIGIICGPYQQPQGPVYGSRPAYAESVAMAGGLPWLIVPTLPAEALRDIYEHLDGLVIAGGGDVDPARYGMEKNATIYNVDPNRDEAEILMIRWAVADDKPTLGICRGCQIANVALGGTLYRDIASEYPQNNGVLHEMGDAVKRENIAHTATIDESTRLAQALGVTQTGVNSLHHQAVRDLAPGLRVAARSEDGIVEGIERPDSRFFVGVQWHPEEMAVSSKPESVPMRRLFEALVNAARR